MDLSPIMNGGVPTPDELYEMATFIDDAATVAFALRGTGIKESKIDSIMNFFEKTLGMTAQILMLGLDENNGTFAKEPTAGESV